MAAELIDARGTVHRPCGGEARIVSLVPSLTELLFDLGLGEQVVGRTHFCIHPAEGVAGVASVGGTKKISVRKLAALEPTHVVLNIDENTEAMAAAVAAVAPNLIVTHPIEPRDNLALYRLLGGIFGRTDRAELLCGRFAAALASLQEAAAGWPKRRVLYLIWKDPWMTVSRPTYVSRLLALAGWETVGHDPAARYPEIAIDAALLATTDLVLFSSEPYPFKRADIDAFRAAYPTARTRLCPIDGEMTSWYGSRAIAGLDYLRRTAVSLFDG